RNCKKRPNGKQEDRTHRTSYWNWDMRKMMGPSPSFFQGGGNIWKMPTNGRPRSGTPEASWSGTFFRIGSTRSSGVARRVYAIASGATGARIVHVSQYDLERLTVRPSKEPCRGGTPENASART